MAAFRIGQEALTNVARHAGARHCLLRLSVDRDGLAVEIVDDGRGIATERHRGIGMISMRERAEELGGALTVESGPSGTTVRALLPRRGATAFFTKEHEEAHES
jgi:two-component system NarL family sensor kinase